MKILRSVVLMLAVLLTVSARAQYCVLTEEGWKCVAGSFQWVTMGFQTYETARASLASTGTLISTNASGEAPRYVVKNYVFVDLWCCYPEHWEDATFATRDSAIVQARAWRGYRRTTGTAALSDGTYLAWVARW